MTEITKQFLLGTLSSIAAAVLLASVGFAATKLRITRAGHEHSATMRLVDLPETAGSLSGALKPRTILLGLLLAVLSVGLGEAVTVELSSSGIGAPESAQTLRMSGKQELDQAESHSRSLLQEGENEAQRIWEDAEQRSRRLRKSRNHADLEEASRIISQGNKLADRAITWYQQQSEIVVRRAEREAEDLRRQAESLEKNQAAVRPTSDFPAGILASFMKGVLLAAFLGVFGRKLGLFGQSNQGFIAVGIMILVMGVSTVFVESFGILNAFGPLLISSALYTSARYDFSAGEVILNSLYIVYRRFGLSIVLVSIVGGIGILAAVICGLTIGLITEQSFGPEILDNISMLYATAVVRVSIIVGDFFSDWVGALVGAMFLSSLIDSSKLKSTASSN